MATEKTNLRILSLDGGGIRGLSSLLILEEIFKRLNAKRRQNDPEAPFLEPCDYFHLIGGTSTGGIIALMLGRLRMNVKQCKEEYLKLAQRAFVPKKGRFRTNRFNARKFEAILIDVVRRYLSSDEGVFGRENAPLIDPLGVDCCKTIAYTLSLVNANPAEAVALRTYHTDREVGRPFTVWEAARATSAAPTFFEPLILQSDQSQWVDAGLNINNPADQVLQEAKQLWGEENHKFSLERIGLFLTIGTGVSGNVSLQGGFRNEMSTRMGIPENLIRSMIQFTFDSEGPHERLQRIFREVQQTSRPYFRFNPENNLRDIQFFESKRIQEVEARTLNFLSYQATQDRLDQCVAQAYKAFATDPAIITPPQPLHQYSLSELISLQKHNSDLLQLIEPYDARKYFRHLTVKGMEVYEAMWTRLSKDVDNCITIRSFTRDLCIHDPLQETIRTIWFRLRGDDGTRMPRNIVLCMLYMIHIECFDSRFHTHRPMGCGEGRNSISDNRFEIAKSFGNWIDCRFHKGGKWCGRSWNYSNGHLGMCKGLETNVECDLWLFHDARLRSFDAWTEGEKKRLTAYPGDHHLARKYRDECMAQFAKDQQSPRYS